MRKTLEDSTNVSEILYTFNNQDILVLSSVQFSCSVVSDCLQSHASMPDFPVYQQLPDLTQTQFHWSGDAIQPSHPL